MANNYEIFKKDHWWDKKYDGRKKEFRSLPMSKQEFWNAKQKAFKIVLVRNYEGQSLEKLFNSLSDFEQDGFNPTVLLCTTEKVFEKMRRYEKNEYRLFYSLCGNKIIISDN